MLDLKAIEAGIKVIAAEKKISEDKIKEIIEAALKTAYKKDYSSDRDEKVNITMDFTNYKIDISVEKTVVEVVENPGLEISFDDLGEDAENFSQGDIIELDMTDEVMKDGGESFGRIASQAARQVIIQKLGDSEKEKIYELFKGKEGTLVHLKVEMVDGGKVIFDYNGNSVVLPKSEQVSRDDYVANKRYYLYVAEVSQDENMPPKVIISRKREDLVALIFAEHVPEINEGIVDIDRVVRFPGVKTKMLVSSSFDEIDAVGTLIGQKGIRVKSVMEELSGEKIDIIPNNGNIIEVIKKAISPAEVMKVDINEKEESVIITLAKGERAKAVGRNGVNVNLASDLIGYKISLEEFEATE